MKFSWLYYYIVNIVLIFVWREIERKIFLNTAIITKLINRDIL